MALVTDTHTKTENVERRVRASARTFPTQHMRALAPEGISCAGLSSPQRLKPIHLDCQMYGLKAVPFKK
jgi:hypothetical protein